MPDRIYQSINGFIGRFKTAALFLIGIIVFFCALNLPHIKYDNDIETMLPGAHEVARDMRFLREAGFSNKVILSLNLASPGGTTDELLRAADALAGVLPGPLVTSAVGGISTKSIQEEIPAFLRLAPQVISADELESLDKRLTPEGVDEALRRNYQRLLTPAGIFFAPFIRSDPMGITTAVFARLQKLSSAVGYSGVIERNHFLSADSRHTMLILDTPVALTDGFGSRALIQYVNERLKDLPAYVQARIVAGHTHTLSNEDVIKRDIVRTGLIAAAAFLLIFLAAFRDLRAGIFFLIPLAAVVIAINLAGMVFSSLSYFVIGMGAVIVGIADDYGIHVYTAVRTAHDTGAVRRIVKPLLTAALITGSVFAAFFFSGVPGYHQLAFFATVSIFLCLFFVIFIFPHFLKEDGGMAVPLKPEAPVPAVSDRRRIGIWCAVVLALAAAAGRVRFSSDVRQFDGTAPAVLAAEDDFKRAWGIHDQPAILVCEGTSEDEALVVTEGVARAARESGGPELVSFAGLWPPAASRVENAARWQKFWRDGREEKLKGLLARAAPAYNFSADAFDPFFKGLYDGLDARETPEGLQFYLSLKERFIQRRETGWQAMSFFSDEERSVAALRSAARLYPGAFVVSRAALSQAISNSISREVMFLSILAGALILLLTFFLLRDVKLTFISLAATLSAGLAVLGTFALLGRPMNAASLIGFMVVVGLSIDYGIFMVYSCRHDRGLGTVKAVWVSAGTTIIGAASLLFAGHPVLFSIGLTLTSGLLAGFFSSQYVVPSLYRLLTGRRGEAVCAR